MGKLVMKIISLQAFFLSLPEGHIFFYIKHTLSKTGDEDHFVESNSANFFSLFLYLTDAMLRSTHLYEHCFIKMFLS